MRKSDVLIGCLLLALSCGTFCHASYAKGIFDFILKGDSNDEPIASEDKNVSEFFPNHKLFVQTENLVSLGEAKLIAIDKISASSEKLTVKVNEPIFFHNITNFFT